MFETMGGVRMGQLPVDSGQLVQSTNSSQVHSDLEYTDVTCIVSLDFIKVNSFAEPKLPLENVCQNM